MTDILEELDEYESFGIHPAVCDQAAEEIKKLRKDNARLRASLRGIALMDVYTRPSEQPAHEVMVQIANEALVR